MASASSLMSCPLSDLKVSVLKIGLACISPPIPENSLSGFNIDTFIPRRPTSRHMIMVFETSV